MYFLVVNDKSIEDKVIKQNANILINYNVIEKQKNLPQKDLETTKMEFKMMQINIGERYALSGMTFFKISDMVVDQLILSGAQFSQFERIPSFFKDCVIACQYDDEQFSGGCKTFIDIYSHMLTKNARFDQFKIMLTEKRREKSCCFPLFNSEGNLIAVSRIDENDVPLLLIDEFENKLRDFISQNNTGYITLPRCLGVFETNSIPTTIIGFSEEEGWIWTNTTEYWNKITDNTPSGAVHSNTSDLLNHLSTRGPYNRKLFESIMKNLRNEKNVQN